MRGYFPPPPPLQLSWVVGWGTRMAVSRNQQIAEDSRRTCESSYWKILYLGVVHPKAVLLEEVGEKAI